MMVHSLIRNSIITLSLTCLTLCFDSFASENEIAPEIDCIQSETSEVDSALSATKPKRQIAKISIINSPIFDETEDDTLAIHRFANWMHVNTNADVIRERLPFKKGDTLDKDDLLEAERIIRSQRYIRDAKITFKESCNINEPAEVEIQTWDNWSLIPTVSFGRKGGENKLSLGIKEDNVLGTGIRARFKYNSDVQRTGYQFSLKSAFPLIEYSTIFLDFMDNDDGQLTQIEFDKPFYHLRSDSMFNLSYLSEEKTEDMFQNGLTRNRFDQKNHRYAISAGMQLSTQDNHSTRVKFGYVDESVRFTPTNLLSTADAFFLPNNRDFQYPWIGVEYLERDFKTMSDIYLIHQTEDINFGWHHEIKFGLELNDVAAGSDLGYHFNLLSSKGYEINDGLMLLSIDAQGDLNTRNPDRYSLSGNLEYFKRYTDLIGFYSRVSGTASNNAFLDIPIAIGDENGVRGYPLQYQHGDNAVTASIEARFYTDYNILKILDVGFVTFADAGKAWSGEQAQFNETNSLLSSIGVGLRLYSSRSSHKSVIHMDFSKPFATSDNVDSWEWRLQIKQSF